MATLVAVGRSFRVAVRSTAFALCGSMSACALVIVRHIVQTIDLHFLVSVKAR